MNTKDLIELCIKNLFRRKTRTILSIIGVVVGTSAIVVMMSIGYGLSEGYKKQIEEFGNLHLIKVRSSSQEMGEGMKNQKGLIDDDAIKNFEKIEGVEAVTPIMRGYVNIIAGRAALQTDVYGVDIDVFEKFNFKLSEGKMIGKSSKNEIIFGSQLPTWFIDNKSKKGTWKQMNVNVMKEKKMFLTGDMEYGKKSDDKEGQKIKYKEYPLKTAGILEGDDEETGYICYMDIKKLTKIIEEIKSAQKEKIGTKNVRSYHGAWIYVGDINLSGEISKTLKDEGYQSYSPSDWLEETKKTSKMIQGILGGIGGISLLVAAFGIANTMIMSIYERTKEIGVMKVIGANLNDIKSMFIIEAGLIGFLGGCFGVIVSYTISILMNTVMRPIITMVLEGMSGGMSDGAISVIPPYLSIASIIAATLIGLVAGYMPAKRAMNLSALESLRNE